MIEKNNRLKNGVQNKKKKCKRKPLNVRIGSPGVKKEKNKGGMSRIQDEKRKGKK